MTSAMTTRTIKIVVVIININSSTGAVSAVYCPLCNEVHTNRPAHLHRYTTTLSMNSMNDYYLMKVIDM